MDAPKTDSPREITIELTLEGRGTFSGRGPADLVFSALREFREEIRTAASEPAAPVDRAATSPTTAASTGPQEKPSELRPSSSAMLALSPFLKAKAPKTNPEAVAVMAVWDARKNGRSEFTIKSITELWRSSGRKAAGNIARDISDAAREGWIDKKERGKYVISTFGEEFVDKLPRPKE